MNDFAGQSYERHIRNEQQNAAVVPSIIGAPDSLDAWRHIRMHETAALVAEADPDASWLTIGDSGSDAFWLSRRAKHVTASSISTSQLSYLQQAGHLPGVTVAAYNAEAIDRADESVDYVYCKEAYHHFPRPAIGLHEMCRVARRAVVLCEPADRQGRLFDFVSSLAKHLLRADKRQSQQFEPVGNFIFSLSLRETQKLATSLQYHSIFWRGVSDFYVPSLSRKNRDDRVARGIFEAAVFAQSAACRLGLMSWGRIAVVIFKQPPDEALRQRLLATRMREIVVPRNPYV